MTTSGNDPMDEGTIAAANGEPITANPYPAGSDESEKWNAGHNYSATTDEDGEYKDDE